MKLFSSFAAILAVAGVAVFAPVNAAKADKLDDVINAGKLRCGVVLDFPPIGFRDADNNPAGFDEDMKGKRIAAAVGTVPEIEFLKYAEKWGTTDLYQGYQSENEVFLAVAQGKADAGITTNTAVKPIAAQYDTIIAGPRMPWTTDYTSVVGPRKDFGWLNYLNLFVTHQVRSGRYQELWDQFVGGEAPELRIPGVLY